MAGKDRFQDQREQPAADRRITTGCLAGLLYAMFVIGVSMALAIFGWNAAKDVLGMFKEEKVVVVEVPENFTVPQLAKQLKDQGVIEHAWLFSFFGNFSKAQDKIDPGKYELRTTLDYHALVNSMRESATTREEIRISIPEGYTLRQIIELLAEKEVSTEELLWETAKTHNFEYDFLVDVPMTESRLEGYLFPDTYDFFIKEKPVSVFNKMLANFDRKLTDEMRERAKELERPLSEIIVIASMVEREAANDDERGLVASVIYNRLGSKNFPTLGIDATIQYILPVAKAVLSQEDLEIDSPYNTRLYPGLPPGPIASPGLNSIRAALWPDESDYYWYVLTPTGHQFCKTEKEFEKAKNDNADFLNNLGNTAGSE